MRIFSFILLFMVSVASLQAQPDILWQGIYGGSATDQGISIYATDDGGNIVASNVRSIDGDVLDKKNTDTLTYDVWLIKSNSINEIEWKRTVGGSANDFLRSIIQTNDGGYITVGTTYSNDGDISGNHGNSDILIVKMNASGDIEWLKCVGGSGYEAGQSIIPTLDGSFLVVGTTYNSGTSGDLSGVGSNGWTDWFVFKIDSSGTILWKNGFGGNLDDHALDAITTSDGGYILVGDVESYAGSGDVTQNIGNNHTYDVWVIKLNSTGSIVWKSNFGGTQYDWGKDIVELADGTFIVAGQTNSSDNDASASRGQIDGFVVKLDASGNKIWTEVYGGSGDDSFEHLILQNDNTLILAGTTSSNDGDVSTDFSGSDGWLVNIDLDGNLIWQKCYGSNAKDQLFDLKQSGDNIIVTGVAGEATGDITSSKGGSDVWVAELGTIAIGNHSLAAINDTVNEESTAIIPITVSDLSATDNIIAYQFDIDFDNTTLEYSAADLTGTLAEGGTVEVNTSVAGKLSISYMNSTALVGTGEILNLQFSALKADTTEVLISNAYLNSTAVTDLSDGIVIVRDITPPAITCPGNATAECSDDLTTDSQGTATATDNFSASADISIGFTDVSDQDPDPSGVGHYNFVITRTWTATDPAGNSSSCDQTIAVVDYTLPIIDCPVHEVVEFSHDMLSTIQGSAIATDNCAAEPYLWIIYEDVSTQDPNPDEAGHYNYVITRLWRATDPSGNSADCVQIITVEDHTPPAFTAPGDITIYKDAACAYDASTVVTGDVINEVDDGGVGEATYIDAIDHSDPCAELITRTWSLVDYSGNSATDQVQTIKIVDNTPPSFTVVGDIMVPVTLCGNIDAPPEIIGGVENEADNCGVGEATYIDNVDYFNICAPIIYRTWSLVDNCGNSAADQVQTIIGLDETPPTAAITYDNTENRCGDELLITASFSESMSDANAVKISMTGGATLAADDMTRISETIYTYILFVPNSSGNVTVSLSNGTDLGGNEVVATPTSGETFSITPITYGDVDDDGTIFAYDAALTLQYSVGLDPLPAVDPLPWENWRDTTANVDRIGFVSANDAAMILQYSAGLIESFDGSSKKSAMDSDVIVDVVDGNIVFYSSGNLIGLNVSTDNENNILGEPVIVAENFLSAKNIDGSTYKIGLCSSAPAPEGDDLIKIPFADNGQVSFDMVVNTVPKSVTVDLATGLVNIGSEEISIYPNPTRDILYIDGLQNVTEARIYNTNGQLILDLEIGALNDEISVAGLPAGMYILQMNIDDHMVVKRFTKE